MTFYILEVAKSLYSEVLIYQIKGMLYNSFVSLLCINAVGRDDGGFRQLDSDSLKAVFYKNEI